MTEKSRFAVDGKPFAYHKVSDADSCKIFFGNELFLEEKTAENTGTITV